MKHGRKAGWSKERWLAYKADDGMALRAILNRATWERVVVEMESRED